MISGTSPKPAVQTAQTSGISQQGVIRPSPPLAAFSNLNCSTSVSNVISCEYLIEYCDLYTQHHRVFHKVLDVSGCRICSSRHGEQVSMWQQSWYGEDVWIQYMYAKTSYSNPSLCTPSSSCSHLPYTGYCVI